MLMLAETADKMPTVLSWTLGGCAVAVVALALGFVYRLLVFLPLPLILFMDWAMAGMLQEPGFGETMIDELGWSHVLGCFAGWNLPFFAITVAVFTGPSALPSAGLIMLRRAAARHPCVRRGIVAMGIGAAMLWVMSLGLFARFGVGEVYASLSRGMLRIAAGEASKFDLQFVTAPIKIAKCALVVPDSLGLHFPFAEVYSDGFSVHVPLVAVWIPAMIFALLTRRYGSAVQPGHCERCGYDLRGGVSVQCPECGSVANTARVS
jgi:hypothetical protein